MNESYSEYITSLGNQVEIIRQTKAFLMSEGTAHSTYHLGGEDDEDPYDGSNNCAPTQAPGPVNPANPNCSKGPGEGGGGHG